MHSAQVCHDIDFRIGAFPFCVIGDQEKNNDSTDHIHQHENTTIVSRHKPDDQIKSDQMLHLTDTILWSKNMDNYKSAVVQT